jgi:hypothetical protein
MMPARAKAAYSKYLDEPVQIRRVTGSGSSLVDTSYATVGRVFSAARRELVGGIAQQDMTAIISAQELFDAGLPSDVAIGDYLIDQDGIEHSVYEVKPRRVQGVMVGYELTVRA